MFMAEEGEFFSKDRYRVVPMVDTLWTYLYNIMIYSILAWYMDNVLSQNRGVTRPWYFPFMLSFWFPFLEKHHTSIIIDKEIKNPQAHDTYSTEKNLII